MSDEQTQLPDSENPHAAEFAVLEALRAEVENLKDQRLRALAEAENIRRRAEREKSEASQYEVDFVDDGAERSVDAGRLQKESGSGTAAATTAGTAGCTNGVDFGEPEQYSDRPVSHADLADH